MSSQPVSSFAFASSMEVKTMVIEPLQAAKYLAQRSGWQYTNLELQKLLYITHMTYLGKTGKSLLTDTFEAWDLGPVIPQLYYHLRSHLSQSIPPSAFDGVDDLEIEFHEQEMKALDSIASYFPHSSASKLVGYTHERISAWWKRYQPGVKGIPIFNSDIAQEYENSMQLARQ